MVGNPSTDESHVMRVYWQFRLVEDSAAKGIRLEHSRQFNEIEERMETTTIDSILIFEGREEDGRWWADIESMPGVMAYGASRESAIATVRALALRVAADGIERRTEGAKPFQNHSQKSSP
jgi:predicted RNase H-like HicB family nuclease